MQMKLCLEKRMKKKIDLKVATIKEALWIRVRDARKVTIQSLEEDLIVNKEVLKLAEKFIKEERAL